ncbi:VWA domain-containing protein [Rufibacter aurantiacus]|uniref:VWA domain-containing protein n=1 Tax=Rufibacter aurantiacus TaxID=2817374 RepID=UPI001B30FAA9|nr:VWA domain-containing protein [Rufibacter aurantiacus]
MQSLQIHTAYSPWYALLCLAAGIGVSWFMYRRGGPWPTGLRLLLASLRALLVALVCFLLLEPYTRRIRQEEVKPKVVLALDNSQSVGLFTSKAELSRTLQGLDALAERLQKSGLEVVKQSFQEADSAAASFAQTPLKAPMTNLHALVEKGDRAFRSQNLAATVLISDGIHNQGPTPTFQLYNAPIYPLALGDTVAKRDVVLEEVQYNKINYTGTSFPVVARVRHNGFNGTTATVLLQENGKTVQRKTVSLPRGGTVQTSFQVTAAQPGKKHFQVLVQPLTGEFTNLNNSRHAYLEVIKGKLKVLVAAAAPHPDIKALRSALRTNQLLDVEVVLGPFQNPSFKTPYDAAILHQIPNATGVGTDWLRRLRTARVPTFYILGAQTDFNAFNSLQAGVQLNRPSPQFDEVQPLLNTTFQRFSAEPTAQTRIKAWPPTPVTFGEWRIAPAAEVILQQQVGAVRTTKPLLVYKPAAPTPSAVLLTDGSWQWRLTESVDHGSSQIYDELMTHLVQLLANRRNQKRLHVYPVKDEFEASEGVALQADVFNAVQEEIFGQDISLTLTHEGGKQTRHRFRHEQGGEGLRLGNLPVGVYRYTATARVENQNYTDAGEFVVQEQNLESLMAVADHSLLSQIAERSETRLYYPAQLAQLEQDLIKANFKTILRSHEEEKDLLEQPWFYFLLLGLACAEWALRRFYGSL